MPLEHERDCHPFQMLARAIAHQQLNGTAANTILSRLIDGLRQGAFPTPQMPCSPHQSRALRAAGFSFAKVAALRDLATEDHHAAGARRETRRRAAPDDEIIARLTQVRGIGRWTVEMLLMFRLERPDVLPVDDFGVRQAFAPPTGSTEHAASEGACDLRRALAAVPQHRGLVPVARTGPEARGPAARA